ncbi:MAG: hypothetical protein ACI9DF_002305 [Verrucomicrobiales bacterium]|jgi:hypothetical protein
MTIGCQIEFEDIQCQRSFRLSSATNDTRWNGNALPTIRKFVSEAPAIPSDLLFLYYPAARMWLGTTGANVNWNNVVGKPDSRAMSHLGWNDASASKKELLGWLLKQELIRV